MPLCIQASMGKPIINWLLWFVPILRTWNHRSRVLPVVLEFQSGLFINGLIKTYNRLIILLLMSRLTSIFGS